MTPALALDISRTAPPSGPRLRVDREPTRPELARAAGDLLLTLAKALAAFENDPNPTRRPVLDALRGAAIEAVLELGAALRLAGDEDGCASAAHMAQRLTFPQAATLLRWAGEMRALGRVERDGGGP